MHPGRRLHLAGFSLGGNFSLRVAARAREAGIDLQRVVAVCPVLDPEHTLAASSPAGPCTANISSGSGAARCARSSRPGRTSIASLDDILRLVNLTDMTDQLARAATAATRRCRNTCAAMRIVGHVLESLDDTRGPARAHHRRERRPDHPCVRSRGLPKPRALEITRTRFGGHCGFFAGGTGPAWLEREILRELQPLSRCLELAARHMRGIASCSTQRSRILRRSAAKTRSTGTGCHSCGWPAAR